MFCQFAKEYVFHIAYTNNMVSFIRTNVSEYDEVILTSGSSNNCVNQDRAADLLTAC